MLTKDLVRKLSPEQQEILAGMEVRKTERRQKLLEQARGLDWRSRYYPVYLFGVFLVFVTLYYFNCFQIQTRPAIVYLPLGVGVVFSLVFYINRANRRLDALLELLESDLKQPEKTSPRMEEKAD
jgi:hypothetical protein